MHSTHVSSSQTGRPATAAQWVFSPQAMHSFVAEHWAAVASVQSSWPMHSTHSFVAGLHMIVSSVQALSLVGVHSTQVPVLQAGAPSMWVQCSSSPQAMQAPSEHWEEATDSQSDGSMHSTQPWAVVSHMDASPVHSAVWC